MAGREVAGRAGVTATTIRFWKDRHLLPPPARTPAGYRDYDPAVLERIAFIRQAQAAGLTLDAIGQVLGIRDGGQPLCVHREAFLVAVADNSLSSAAADALVTQRLAAVGDPHAERPGSLS